MSDAPRFLLWPIVLLAGVVGYLLGRTPAPPPVLLDPAIARLDTVYVRDTLTMWRTVKRVDTLTQTVERWKTDTLAVTQYVTLADSALQACASVVRTCEARLALERQNSVKATHALHVSLAEAKRERWLWALAGLGLGTLVGLSRP